MIPFNKPKRIAEANIQALLFKALIEEGVNCYLEYKHKEEGKRGCRFDVVILDKTKKFIIGIIECKSVSQHRLEKRRNGMDSSNQIARYKELGLPVFYCLCLSDIGDTVQQAKKLN